jgi:hypothetical protein
MNQETEKQIPIIAVTAGVMLVVALFGWGFAAAGYAHHAEGWREEAPDLESSGGTFRGKRKAAFADFVMNGVSQLPNFPAVVSYTFAEKMWLAVVIGVLEILALAGGFGLKLVESNLSQPPRRPSGTKGPTKIRTPRP